MPEMWLLGSSGYSAQLAGYLGMPFAFAHHFSAENTLPALQLYRRSFRPSARYSEPHVLVAVMVLCGDTDEEAERLAAPAGLTFIRRMTGRRSPLPTVEEALAFPYSDAEKEAIRLRNASQAVGGPETVRLRLEELVIETAADEVMCATSTFAQRDRLRSYERVAEIAGLTPR
jgi:luciferase family oxidoreductase group 1